MEAMSNRESSALNVTQGTALDSSSITRADTSRALSYFVSLDEANVNISTDPTSLEFAGGINDSAWDDEDLHPTTTPSCKDQTKEISEDERIATEDLPAYRCVACRAEFPEAIERDATTSTSELVCHKCRCRIFEKMASRTSVAYSTD
jgi:DNA-directed RNA polymerase subunit RPC12/RpoP